MARKKKLVSPPAAQPPTSAQAGAFTRDTSSPTLGEGVTPVTREQALARLRQNTFRKVVPGFGVVLYRHLGFEERIRLSMSATGGQEADRVDFAISVMIAGLVEPCFTEDDRETLKAGSFDIINVLSKLPLENPLSTVTQADVGKP